MAKQTRLTFLEEVVAATLPEEEVDQALLPAGVAGVPVAQEGVVQRVPEVRTLGVQTRVLAEGPEGRGQSSVLDNKWSDQRLEEEERTQFYPGHHRGR